MRRYVAACLALLFGIGGMAHPTSSLAWSKALDVNGGSIALCTEANGNVTFGHFTSSVLTVTKYDPYGGQIWSNSSLELTSLLLRYLAADNLGNTYAATLVSSTPNSIVLMKYGPDGTPLWSAAVNVPNSTYVLALQADALGVRVAYGDSAHVAAAYVDTNGFQTGSLSDTAVAPVTGKFGFDENLLVSGNDTGVPGNSRCRVYKPNSALLVDYSTNGSCVADSDELDNVYIAGSLGGMNPTFQLAKYNSQGVQQWSTNPAYGTAYALSAAFSNQIFLNNSTTGQLELFDPDVTPFPQSGPPTPVFAETLSYNQMVADPGGGVVTTTNNVIRRYDLHGMLTWAQTYSPAGLKGPAFLSVYLPATSGSQTGPDPVYFAGDGYNPVDFYFNICFGKYVANTAMLQLQLSPTYVTGGSPVVGTVTLTSNAGPGGAPVALASSFPAFVDPPATMTINQGSSTGTFAATTVPVDVPGAVTLSATFGGARRSAVVNVIPATLFSVTTPVSMVKGGTYVTGTVNLTGRAGPAGRSLALSSSNTSAATVPPGVNVAPYASAVNFVIATKHVAANTAVTITARSGTLTKTTTLTVTP